MRTKLLCVVALGLLVVAYADIGAQPEPKKKGGPGDPWFKKQQTSETVTRWEYRAEYASTFYTKSNTFDVTGLNKLGAEGWDLVAINPGPPNQQGMAMFIFRRPSGAVKIEPKAIADPAPKAMAEPKLDLRIYLLKNANASDIANIVGDVVRAGKQTVRIVPDPRTNQVIVFAPTDMHDMIEALIQRIDIDILPPNPPKAGKKKD